MKIIKQLFWIFLFSLFGEFVSILVSSFIIIPGSVIGMISLFLALHFNFLDMSAVEEVGTWLTDNMAILFVPIGVGLMTTFSLLADFWLELLITMLITSTVMMGFIGFIVQKLNERAESAENRNIKKDVENND